MPNQFRTTGQQPSPPGIFHYHGGFPQRRSSSLFRGPRPWTLRLTAPTLPGHCSSNPSASGVRARTTW